MVIYDDKGRVIQEKSTNATGGTDVITTQYGWQGLPLVTVQKQQKSGTTAQTIITVTKNNYDVLGRIEKVEKRQALNGGAMSDYATISQVEYDALGRVKQKKLGTAPLEMLAYDYNIRGWLLGANRDFAKTKNDATRYFGFDLGYDQTAIKSGTTTVGTYAKAAMNGNIGGMVWKSKGDDEIRKYDFGYDAVSRIMKADFTQYTGSSFNTTAGVDFSTTMGDGSNPATAYDANGNILSMNQKGLKISASSPIDQLTYTYQTKSNKLRQVTDGANDEHSTLGDFKYDPATKGSTDYTYDVNGNLTADANNKISSITYNHLNLPEVITVTGKGTITYTYDAAGNKLKKTVVDNTVSPSETITTLYLGNTVYRNDTLQFITREEGRIRPVRDVNNNITSFVYDYFLTDHLGNVRMVLTEEQKQDIYPIASLETSKVAIEEQYYDIQSANIVSKSVATGISNYKNNNGISNNPPDPTFENTNSVKLYRLNSNSNKAGLGITLKVMSGDKIDVFGKSYYFQNTGGQSGNNTLPVLDLLAAFIGAPSTPDLMHGLSAETLNTPAGILGIQSLITNQDNQSNASPTRPRAFINVIFFDEQFKSYNYRLSMIGSNSVVKDHYSELQNINAEKSGYVFIYCSNESPVDVYFDNLQVVHTRGPILEETHYYPFGLTMAGISSKAALGLENRYKYNGKELQHNEFSDNSGLELYDFGARMQDPQLGRFFTQDRFAESYHSLSPYQYTADNPINYTDYNGDYITIDKKDDKGNIMLSLLYENGKAYFYSKDKNGNPVKGDAWDGKDAFITGTVNDLNSVSSFKEGKALVGDLQGSTERLGISENYDENAHYINKNEGIVYNQSNSGYHDGVNFDKSFIKLGHELSHAWDDYIGRSDLMYKRGSDNILISEQNAVRFENYLRAMSGEKTMRLTYGNNRINFSGSSPEFFKNFSFPLRKGQFNVRLDQPISPYSDNTIVRKDIYQIYDTRAQKFVLKNN